MSLLERIAVAALKRIGWDLDFDLDFQSAPFDAITSELALGARPRPDQVDAIRELGVTHVVSCLPEGHRADMAFLAESFETLFLPLRDGVLEDIGSTFPDFFAFADRGHVLVHCEVGVSRSATLATALVMKRQNLRFYEAFQRVRTRRPQILPNVGFATHLQRFEDTLFDARETPSLVRYLKEVSNVPVEIEVLQDMLELNDHDAVRAIHAIFGEEVPRVIQGFKAR